MARNTLSAALTSVIALTFLATAAVAAEVKSVGANPSSDQLIQALSPEPGTPPLKFRGIRLLTAKAAAEPEARAPAVALDIKFALNSAELTPEAKETVKQLGAAMKSDQLASYHFLLEGHTDSTGSHDRNMELSKRRAEVRAELSRRQLRHRSGAASGDRQGPGRAARSRRSGQCREPARADRQSRSVGNADISADPPAESQKRSSHRLLSRPR